MQLSAKALASVPRRGRREESDRERQKAHVHLVIKEPRSSSAPSPAPGKRPGQQAAEQLCQVTYPAPQRPLALSSSMCRGSLGPWAAHRGRFLGAWAVWAWQVPCCCSGAQKQRLTQKQGSSSLARGPQPLPSALHPPPWPAPGKPLALSFAVCLWGLPDHPCAFPGGQGSPEAAHPHHRWRVPCLASVVPMLDTARPQQRSLSTRITSCMQCSLGLPHSDSTEKMKKAWGLHRTEGAGCSRQGTAGANSKGAAHTSGRPRKAAQSLREQGPQATEIAKLPRHLGLLCLKCIPWPEDPGLFLEGHCPRMLLSGPGDPFITLLGTKYLQPAAQEGRG